MRVRPKSEKFNDGKLIVIYSETGVGKSTSCFQTLPTPMLYMCAEARNAEISAQASGRPLKRGDFSDVCDYVIAEYTTWEEFISFLWMTDAFDPFKSIVLDGITQLMINLAIELENQAFEARESKDKPLISQTKLSIEGYGALASQMNRAIIPLGKLTQRGKYIVINSLLQENPKWNRVVQASMALSGSKFGHDFPGACDLIGMAVRRYDENGMVVYPPLVKFECGDGENFQCKWTGKKIKVRDKDGNEIKNPIMHLPLDFNIILGLNSKKEVT